MKIRDMPFKERFDDIIDTIVAMRSEAEESEQQELAEDCTTIFRRLLMLRDDVLTTVGEQANETVRPLQQGD